MNSRKLQELAALNAVGLLEGSDRDDLQRLIALADPSVIVEVVGFNNVAALLGGSLATFRTPSPELKERLLRRLELDPKGAAGQDSTKPESAPGFSLIRGEEASGWRKLPTPGALVKLLSLDPARGYAVVLGKLGPGARYPAHRHSAAEEVYVLSGDLHMGGQVLRAGDFHHADAGTTHGENFSEEGCTILAIVSSQDLLAQLDTP